MVIGVIGALPIIGDIPGMTILIGFLGLVISVQMLLLRNRMWLPSRLLDQTFPADKLQKAVDKALPWLEKIDNVVEPSLRALTGGGGVWLSGLALLIASLSCIPLEFVPFAGTVPCLAIAVLGLSLAVRDGILWIIGMTFNLGSGGLIWWAWQDGQFDKLLGG